MSSEARRTVSDLRDLVSHLNRADGFRSLLASLKAGNDGAVDGAWGSSCALAAAALADESPGTLLVVVPRIADVDEFANDLACFLGDTPLIFPAWESLPTEHDMADAVFGGRLRVLSALNDPSPRRVIITSMPALLQPVPSRADRKRSIRRLQVGEELDPDAFLRWLVERGFQRVAAVELPGEFSMHGGIVDLFPPDAVHPLRVEFFGDEIESIRRFDVETQQKIEELQSAELTLIAPVAGTSASSESTHADSAADGSNAENFLESLRPASWIVLTELERIVDEGKHYLSRLDERRGLYSVDAALSKCAGYPTVSIAPIVGDHAEASCRLRVESIERFTGPKADALDELASVVQQDEHVLIACHNEGERERLAEMLRESKTPVAHRVRLCLGSVSRGFRMVDRKIVVLGDHELFGRTDLRRPMPAKKRIETRAIDSFLDLKQDDLVVHLTKGIARFRGMELLTKDEQIEEHLILEFRDAVRVYVPVSLIHLVQKYVGAAKSAPNLSKLGSTSWEKKKRKVADAVMDLASDMIRLQAQRESRPGIAFPPDSHWQQEFDRAFPYTETEDQLRSIIEVKDDMHRQQPMDRLICGDVGYGKTEVAMRAAFKAIDAGKQVAVLVPTTVLAEQHFRTFCERMAEYPINIEVLSRFKSKSEQRAILEGLEAGAVDIVIGTHRLVQKDVRMKDLGLLVIDEEQRFGVAAKEMLKRLRLEVDVLTMSATPIPRTLHMSLLGIRDISNLVTPPQDRQSIETRICRFDNALIRTAIVRELNRNGQIYFVHNRVYNIQSIADRIREIVPEATVDVGHGQMRENELESAMLRFVSGETDVLVCTTIIESGLDIPNANTIFIHQADRFGLADLHQLRGRVGRYKHRAYCYLLLEKGRSPTSTGAKRLKAIEEFSELGAGFKIAMRDLEIRGAGNILGTEQSGHISTVGYELYCQLLDNAVRRLKQQPIRKHRHVAVDLPVSAYLPDSYVPTGRPKIELYRKLSSLESLEHLEQLEDELRDRFGPVPAESARLLRLKELQILALRWQIHRIHLEERFAVFHYRNRSQIEQLARLHEPDLRIVDAKTAYLELSHPDQTNEPLLERLKSVLQPTNVLPYNPAPFSDRLPEPA